MEEEVEIWVCRSCTFSNDANEDTCAMCYTPKPVFSWCLCRYRGCISFCSFSGFLTNILSGSLTCVFALVGLSVGVVVGALAGRAANSGLFRGAGLGAVAGGVLSVEVLQASRSYWHSQRSGLSSFPRMTAFLGEISSGQFLQECLRPSISTAYRWQVNIMEMSYEELYETLLPEEGRMKGASPEFLERLPQHLVTESRRTDVYGNVICCSICLQELEDGDIARALPACKHTFHLRCVDEWLSRHLLCPVCRQKM